MLSISVFPIDKYSKIPHRLEGTSVLGHAAQRTFSEHFRFASTDLDKALDMTHGYSRLTILTYLSQRLEMTTFEMALYLFSNAFVFSR